MARLLLLALLTWANIANPVFVRVDTRQLPEQAAMTLTQDAAGFIWVGTQGGLARFDGYEFRNFFPDPSDPHALPDGYVRALLADATGLWIGSSTSGLVRYDPRTERFRTWRPDPSDRTGPRSGEVDALLRTPDGALWVGGDGGLDRFDVRGGRFTPQRLVTAGEPPVVWSLSRDRSGTMWAGTQDGLFAKRPDDATFHRFALPGTSAIYSLYEDSGRRLWAGSVGMLFAIDMQRRHTVALRADPSNAHSLAPGQQWSLIEPRPGTMWAGTDNAISIVDPRTFTVRRVTVDAGNPEGLSSGRVVQFFRDRSGLIWIANHIGGVLLYNPRSRGLENLSASRPEIGPQASGALAVAAEPDARLWAGGLDGMLVEIDARSGRRRTLRLPTHAAIQALDRTADGSLWIATTGGLCRLSAGSPRPACPAGPPQIGSESVYAVLDDGRTLAVGGSNGLFLWDRRAASVIHFGHGNGPRELPNDQVRTLYRDRAGRLWIGSENGLDRLDPDGTLVRFLFDPKDPSSLGSGGMTTILEDRAGRIWVGANGGPLNVATQDARGRVRFRHLSTAQGLPHENVDGLAQDARGTIWAATDKGIAQIDPRTLQVRALGLADGVSEAGFWAGAVSQASDGTIFFGGLDGTTIVEPGAASPWTYAPPVVVTALQAGRHDLPPARANLDHARIELPAASRNLELEFSALDYSAPQALQYQYQLAGYDRDWVDASTLRSATYTHVPPGTYTLEVRATNRLGVWSAVPLRVTVYAQPAWYETWWLRALAALFVLAAIYALYRLRTAVLYRRQRELEETVERRTHELSHVNERLQQLSLNDPLTGLRNRRFVSEQLDRDAAIALRRYDAWLGDGAAPRPSDADIVIFLIDLDNFKSVNDRFGHLAGDAVLIGMRERLQEVFRGSDYVARWGGDEFLAVARGSRREDAPELAERLRAAVASHPFALGGDQCIAEHVSIGFAAFPFVPRAPHALGWSQVLALADQALYMAKHRGRNTWYGLGATETTQAALLSGGLDLSVEEAVRAGTLEAFVPAYDLGASLRSNAP